MCICVCVCARAHARESERGEGNCRLVRVLGIVVITKVFFPVKAHFSAMVYNTPGDKRGENQVGEELS